MTSVSQDFAHEAGKGMIIVVNKWDTLEKDNHTMKNWEEDIREQFQYLPYAPIIFVSALTKQRLHKLPEMIKQISESQNTRIPSAVLNDVIMDAIAIKSNTYRQRETPQDLLCDSSGD